MVGVAIVGLGANSQWNSTPSEAYGNFFLFPFVVGVVVVCYLVLLQFVRFKNLFANAYEEAIVNFIKFCTSS